jgi:TRAP-type C4-dicarboxylate transport system substrate-binding protein
MAATSQALRSALCAAVLVALLGFRAEVSAQTPELRYGHIYLPASAAGLQAQMFADAIAKNTNGQTRISVYPSSQLGKLGELIEAVSTGTIALSQQTAGAIGLLFEPFAALDTPYLYRDYDHLMKVTDADSPVMKKLNAGLISAAGLRVLQAYYFGTRHLTANKVMYQPSDLAGQKVRAAPLPVNIAAVRGLGAVPVPLDSSELQAALASGQVVGQENPVSMRISPSLC